MTPRQESSQATRRARAARTKHEASTVAPGFVTGLLSGLVSQGIDPRIVVTNAGLDPELGSSGSRRVSLKDYATLYNGVVGELEDEGFGLFSARLKPGTFEFLCRSVLGSRSLEEVLNRSAKFLSLVLPDLSLRCGIDGLVAWIEIEEVRPIGSSRDDARRVFAFEWLLRLIHGLSCWFVAQPIPLDDVQFPFTRPPQASDYGLIYTENANFTGHKLVAHLKAELFALHVHRDQDDLVKFLEGAPGKITMLYRRDREIARQIRDIITAALPDIPDIAEAADRLHLSLRTVQRRLKQEGSSYRDIKCALRRDIAIMKVEKSNIPISDIAAELGYAESSAFFRAFVEWTGEAPTIYRNRVRSRT